MARAIANDMAAQERQMTIVNKATARVLARLERFMPNGEPRWVRCYDNGGKTFDRYTVVFSGRYTRKTAGEFWYVGMSEHPFHPQGFGQHGARRPSPAREDGQWHIDRPKYAHLGKKIRFADLPPDCRKLIDGDYRYLHDLPAKDGGTLVVPRPTEARP